MLRSNTESVIYVKAIKLRDVNILGVIEVLFGIGLRGHEGRTRAAIEKVVTSRKNMWFFVILT